jgi:Spy/CpxP family protein refolding chaperone
MFLDQLELTDAQKTQIQTIREETRLKIQPLQEQLRKIQTDLQTAVEQGQPEEALLAFGTEQGEVMGQVAGIQAVTQSRIYTLLTTEQKAQLAKAREEMKQHREQRQSRSLQGNRPMREQ